MEYLDFNYKKVNTDITLSNYFDFISNSSNYKQYYFDLLLTQYNKKVSEEKRLKCREYVFYHKVLFGLPYGLISFYLLIKWKRGFFVIRDFDRETKTILHMFCLFTIYRMSHRALIKYHGDKVLLDLDSTCL